MEKLINITPILKIRVNKKSIMIMDGTDAIAITHEQFEKIRKEVEDERQRIKSTNTAENSTELA
jgi:hypothetical protein